MVEENEVSLQTDEDLNLNTQTVGEKRDHNGFLETSSSDQSMCMPNFMTPPSTFIVYVLTCICM